MAAPSARFFWYFQHRENLHFPWSYDTFYEATFFLMSVEITLRRRYVWCLSLGCRFVNEQCAFYIYVCVCVCVNIKVCASVYNFLVGGVVGGGTLTRQLRNIYTHTANKCHISATNNVRNILKAPL